MQCFHWVSEGVGYRFVASGHSLQCVFTYQQPLLTTLSVDFSEERQTLPKVSLSNYKSPCFQNTVYSIF